MPPDLTERLDSELGDREVAERLVAARAATVTPVPEALAERHLAAIGEVIGQAGPSRRASVTPGPTWRTILARRLTGAVAATAATAVLALGLAAGGLLPQAPQQVVVDVARTFGLQLPAADAPAEGVDLEDVPAPDELVPPERQGAKVGDDTAGESDAGGDAGQTDSSDDASVGPSDGDGWHRDRDHTAPPSHAEQTPGRSGDAPGHSDQAPGHSGDTPGRSDQAPGRSGDGPGRSDEAPSRSDGGPGRSDEAPGRSDGGPGRSDEAPGHRGDAPGRSGDAPARTSEAPGGSGDAPSHSEDAPGNSGDAPGRSDDAPGNSGDAPGRSDDGAAGS